MRFLKILAALLALAFAGLLSAYGLTQPELPSELSASAERLRPGPFAVASAEHTFVDPSRPTPAHGDFAGAPSRTLAATLWFPADDAGPHPLVVYSHGFMSMRDEASAIARDLASHGAVVVSADYPATNFGAPGGPNIADAPSQPTDVAFLIDSVTGWSDAERPFRGAIDERRIGVAGLSLGGFTSTAATFHPTLRDPRIAAAISIAGPSAMFTRRFFETASVPFLMIAGDADAIVDYAANAAPIPDKLTHGGALLTLSGGTHTGFSPVASGPMRILGNPDRLGCWALSRNLVLRPRENPFTALGGEPQGIVRELDMPLPCAHGAPARALAAGRQMMITTLAVRAFFESAWAPDAEQRAASARFLAESLPRDFAEAHWRAIAPLPPSRALELTRLPEGPGIPHAEPVSRDAAAPPAAASLEVPRVSPRLSPANP